MKYFFIVLASIQFIATTHASCQSQNKQFRIKKASFFERGGVKYTTEYFYDNSGKVTRILSQYLADGSLITIEERKIEYFGDLVVCKYFPNTSAKNDHRVKYYLRNTNLGDVDSLVLKDGRIHEIIETRQPDAYPPTGKYQFKYSSTNDLLEIKTTFSKKDTSSRTFQYNDKKLVRIFENNRFLKTEFLIDRDNDEVDTVTVFYTRDNVRSKSAFYIFEYSNNILTRVGDASPYSRGETGSRSFEFDTFGNLIMFATRADTGTSGFRYEYEAGKGNARLFQKKARLEEFLFPSVQ